MAKNEQEIEAKFMLRAASAVRAKLEQLGARLESPRVHEVNLRFDTPSGALTQAGKALRLRRDEQVRMTFKGPAAPEAEVSTRQEIEFAVSDLDAARHLLEALGYRVMVMYEKYRTTYRLGQATVVLDEMPYGSFMEVEGADPGEIRQVAERLGLRWEARSNLSYLALFEQLRASRGLPKSDLSFEALAGMRFTPQDLGLEYADG